MKYKVGDKVKVRSWEDMEKERGLDFDGDIKIGDIGFVRDMKEYCGKELTISAVYSSFYHTLEGGSWAYTDEMFEDAPEAATVILYKKDNTVVALDKKTKKEGIAICAPEDKFDFYTGAEIALARLFGKKEPPKKPEPKYYNGEIVCISKDGCNLTVGKVYKVKNGKFYDDNGRIHGIPYPYVSFKDINDNHYSKFAELVR